MQVFVIGSPLETHMHWTPRGFQSRSSKWSRYYPHSRGKSKAWANHPVVRMYSYVEGRRYLRRYLRILKAYRDSEGKVGLGLKLLNWFTQQLRPYFHCQEYYEAY